MKKILQIFVLILLIGTVAAIVLETCNYVKQNIIMQIMLYREDDGD